MSRRLFDHDAATGITEYFHYDESNDTFKLEMVQDVEAILDDNKRSFDSFTSGRDKWGDGMNSQTRVARIPMVIYQQFMLDGSWRDQAFLKRWLNDPDNAVFRTRPGTV